MRIESKMAFRSAMSVGGDWGESKLTITSLVPSTSRIQNSSV